MPEISSKGGLLEYKIMRLLLLGQLQYSFSSPKTGSFFVSAGRMRHGLGAPAKPACAEGAPLGATSLLCRSSRSEEKAKAQGGFGRSGVGVRG